MSRPRLLAPLGAALVLAACGSTTQPTATHPHRPAPHVAPLRVSPTDLRLGDAGVADPAGLHVLRQGARRVDPDHLRLPAPHRQGVGAGASCADADLMPDAASMPRVAAATLCLLNGQRADAGLPALTTNGKLAVAALGHARDMVVHQYFSHVGQDGTTFVDRLNAAHYIPSDVQWLVGENLAWGTGSLATPRSIVAAWMASPPHRENVLRPQFRQIGLGIAPGNPVATDGAGATYATEFGVIGDPDAAPQPAREAVAAVHRKRARHHRRHHRRKAHHRRARVRARIALEPVRR